MTKIEASYSLPLSWSWTDYEAAAAACGVDSASEYLAMLRVMCELANGTIPDDALDMRELVRDSRSCGTVACIGGWVGLRMGLAYPYVCDFSGRNGVRISLAYDRISNYVEGRNTSIKPLYALYYPIHDGEIIAASAAQAARAMRRFLIDDPGDPDCWRHACPELFGAAP